MTHHFYMIQNKLFLTLARTIDHRVGYTDDCKPDVPVLPVNYALASFIFRFIIVFVNFITCAFVIANVIRHW